MTNPPAPILPAVVNDLIRRWNAEGDFALGVADVARLRIAVMEVLPSTPMLVIDHPDYD